jgi:valyl-tRNA synthetase
MSSTQDVRYSDAKVQQGRDLANKLWNASRLILLNAADVEAKPVAERVEDRWILSRLERTIASVSEKLDAYDFAHAVQEAYAFFWSELCDWYLEIAKPRLYDGEAEVSANLLWLLQRTLALLHPIMPFVSEEVWSYHPSRQGHLAVHPFPQPEASLYDEEAEAEMGEAIDLTRNLRTWRDLVELASKSTLPVRTADPLPEFVSRLARVEAADAGSADPIASVGVVQILASPEIDAEAVAARLERRREELRSEVSRAEGKLANDKFVSRAPAELVEEERAKLERYRAELEELAE